jgi:catechol 2,3-dioxygenase-like lactoylglutathione lyase family enzyme
MVRTYGLTHINLVVRDVERSLRFYGQVFGVEEYGRTAGLVHTRTPGCQDVITFDEQASGAGESRGIAHFGFRLYFTRRHRRGCRRSRARRRQTAPARRIQPGLPLCLCRRPG